MPRFDSYTPRAKHELVYLPLGGTGEIGMNLNLYGHAGKWLMIDCGVTFGDDATPGIDIIMPDPAFIAARARDLVGMVLTHAHEDHIGAVPYLWPRLRCPIYATKFTAVLVRDKLMQAGLLHEAKVTEIDLSGRTQIGPFDIELITLTHSIPEPNAIVVRTGAGTVLHTGDWKLDPEPMIGDISDEAALRRIGEEGVLAMVCDSTNALVDGTSGSEQSVHDSLLELIGGCRQRVAVACFASNVARLQTLARIALAHGRQPVLVGRSLWRMTAAARATGYLDDVPDFVSEHDGAFLPRDKVLMICTGSQGEPRAALPRIATGTHPLIKLEPGDTVIFSSRIIPGNEKAIGRMQNQLVLRGLEVLTERDHFVHVSGHPARDELVQMYQWVRPRIAVPTHGEARHLTAHAALARNCQVPEAHVIANGDMILLSQAGAKVVAKVPSGRLAVDGSRLISIDGENLRHRHRMLWNGAAVVTLVVDRDGDPLVDPQLAGPGLLDGSDDDQELAEAIIDEIVEAVAALPKSRRRDDDEVKAAAAHAVRRAFHDRRGKKPATEVHLVRMR